MSPLAPLHPQIVHFVIALTIVGALLRWLSLVPKVPFASPAASLLLLVGAVAAVFAVSSGMAAHQPVEAIPGVAAAVRAHEDWGHRARTVLLIVAALELLGLLLLPLPTFRRWVHVVSAVVCLLGAGTVFVASEKGGELVYSYAGGPGLRTGDTNDITRLFTAGVYEQAMVERARKQPIAAAELIDLLARRWPGDTAIELLRIESLLRDRGDAAGALAALNALHLPADNPRLQVRAGLLAVDAHLAAGQPDSARALLQRLVTQFPSSQRLKDRLAQLGG
jgi:uncharacterized membrane protein